MCFQIEPQTTQQHGLRENPKLTAKAVYFPWHWFTSANNEEAFDTLHTAL